MEIDSLQDLICNLKESMADTYCKIDNTKAELTKYAKSAHQHAISDITNLSSTLSNKADKVNATSSKDGLMSASDKSKLDKLSQHPDSGVTAGTNYKDDQSPGFGASFNIPKLTFNKQGHITASANAKVTLPSLGNTSTTAAKGDHTHNQYLTSHQDISGKENISNKTSSWNSTTNHTRYPTEKLVKDELDKKLNKSTTVGLVKNDGSIDTKTYLTQHQSLTNYIQKSSTTGLIKNDGSIDTKTYLTQHQTIPTGNINTAGIVQLSNATNSSSQSTAATSKAVNDISTSLNNDINGKAASYSILVSNTDGATFETKKFNMPTTISGQKLYASVRKNNQIITNGVVLFIVNGIIYPRQIHYTDSSYYAILNINLPAGTYDVFVHYVGDGRYNSNDPKTGNVIANSYECYTYCMDYCMIVR